MKFSSYYGDVIKYLCLTDYKILMSAYEHDSDGNVLRDLSMNWETVFNILL